jgi:hypothetical protein
LSQLVKQIAEIPSKEHGLASANPFGLDNTIQVERCFGIIPEVDLNRLEIAAASFRFVRPKEPAS